MPGVELERVWGGSSILPIGRAFGSSCAYVFWVTSDVHGSCGSPFHQFLFLCKVRPPYAAEECRIHVGVCFKCQFSRREASGGFMFVSVSSTIVRGGKGLGFGIEQDKILRH